LTLWINPGHGMARDDLEGLSEFFEKEEGAESDDDGK
jgi:hypothetical protein